jgi:hypothetical protein
VTDDDNDDDDDNVVHENITADGVTRNVHIAGLGTSSASLTLCRFNLNPYCMGRKAAFFSVVI